MIIIIIMLAAMSAVFASSKDVVMYHVNPQRFGPIPINMDTADEAGDMFFEMMEVLTIPLACNDSHRSPWSGFSCENPEASDPTDVVNKLTVTVTGGFSEYAMCNVGRNGTDGLGHACKDDTYCCFCFNESAASHHHHWPPPTAPCNATVGFTNVYERHSGAHHHVCLKDYECFASRSSEKFSATNPGLWYSPLAYGACSLHATPAANCTWSVKTVEKIVSKACHTNSFFGAVRSARPACFNKCASSSAATVNASDPCIVRCFYEAVLGPTAGRPFGKVEGGLALSHVLEFWKRPFESSDPSQGGCPALPVPPRSTWQQGSLFPAATHRLTRRQERWRAFTARWASGNWASLRR